MRCILGVDFDNTLINYDDVLWKAARQFGLSQNGVARHKKNIRDVIRQLPDGEIKWQKVQAYAYGKAMDEAVLIDGVQEFFRAYRHLGLTAYIISHKTKYAAQDTERIDLRQTAIGWMTQKGFFESSGLGFSADHVFFESTRQDKIGRIKQLGCTHFIDDLEETFQEESFPRGVQKILYNPHAEKFLVQDTAVFRSWANIKQYFFDGR